MSADVDLRRRVDLLHAQYLVAMRTLFDQHKAACGYPEAQLTML
jgi:hypothetical protein